MIHPLFLFFQNKKASFSRSLSFINQSLAHIQIP